MSFYTTNPRPGLITSDFAKTRTEYFALAIAITALLTHCFCDLDKFYWEILQIAGSLGPRGAPGSIGA
jgi:hypothetical protein